MLTQADIDQWADEGWDLSRLEHREVLMDRLLVMGRQADVELVDHHADLIRLAYALPRYGGVLARIVQELRPWSWARPEQRAALLEGLTEIGHVAVEDEGRRRMRLWLDGRLVSFDGTRNQRLVALEDRQRRSPLLGDPNQRKLFQDGTTTPTGPPGELRS